MPHAGTGCKVPSAIADAAGVGPIWIIVGHWIDSHLAYFLNAYGYWAVFLGLLMENAGIPIPGETILVFACILTAREHRMNIVLVGLVAVIAAVTGDNLGFSAGKLGGRPLLDKYRSFFHVRPETIRRGEQLFHHHGGAAVFLARFITGMRVIAGPLAGTLHMPWSKFLRFNALGAVVWVGVIATLSYILGPSLWELLQRANWLIVLIIAAGLIYMWVRRRYRVAAQPDESKAA